MMISCRTCFKCCVAALVGLAPSSSLLAQSLFLHSYPATTSTALYAAVEERLQKDKQVLSRLISSLGGSPLDLLRLDTTSDGVRGVYLNKATKEGNTLLKMPLASCLRDDRVPPWLNLEGDNDDDSGYHQTVQIQGWVTRLAASLLHAAKENENNGDQLSKGMEEWLDLILPLSLKDSLPVYWSESALRSTNCRPLELAVDSAFFARAGPLSDLSASNATQAQIEQALDLVQTRACRCSALEEEESTDGRSSATSDLRVLVPVFDMINHNYEPNAEFFREGDFMMVRTLRNMEAGEEVYIHYGSATMPVWKCLFSYGFVPSGEDVYEHNCAEIVVDQYRFEVSPTEIPFELVQYQAQKMGYENLENVEFTPEIGNAIVKELQSSARALEQATQTDIPTETLQLVNRLIESHRRTLLACAGGLTEFMEGQNSVSTNC
eukprot:scaffold6103_cov116-Cylindrotheca_fusiformis.AAC.4